MIGGTIHINEHNKFCEWGATNEGPALDAPGTTRYACHIKYRDMKGYVHNMEFDVNHVFGDGALVLTNLILTEATRRIR